MHDGSDVQAENPNEFKSNRNRTPNMGHVQLFDGIQQIRKELVSTLQYTDHHQR
jgi:hypothetical protein